jgi:hypothetical protein
MTEENDDFFTFDQEAIEAANRLRAIDGSPAVMTSTNANLRRFRIHRLQLRDAVLCSSLQGKEAKPEELHFAVGEGVIELHSAYRNVEVWVRVQGDNYQENVVPPIRFNLVEASAHRLAALKSVGTIDAQIRLNGADQRELRLQVGTTRLRLTAAQIAPSPAAPTDNSDARPRNVDPKLLQTSIRAILSVVAKSDTSSEVVSVKDGIVYGGGSDAIVVCSYPGLLDIALQVAEKDCRILSRILGRMERGRTTMVASNDHYDFCDGLISCRVRRTVGTEMPVAQLLAATAELSFSPILSDFLKTGTIAAIVQPKRIMLKWSDSTERAPDGAFQIKLSAFTPGKVNNCAAVLPGWADPKGNWNSGQTCLDGGLWLAAIGVFDVESRVRIHAIKQGNILKLVGLRDDFETTIFLPTVSD